MTKPPYEHHFFSFENRSGRYDFLRERFADVFSSSQRVLDVGCDENYLKSVYGTKVFGIDIGGSPDRVVDLEKEGLRPLGDGAYDLVICTEVLEHIDNFHEVVRELIRVSSRYVLISLPNCTSTRRFWKIARTGRTGKFYGLPFEKPTDRHKWYFSHSEVLRFMEHLCEKGGLRPAAVIYHYNILHREEPRRLHRLKQVIEAWFVRAIGWKNQSQDLIFLFDKNA